MARHPLFLNFCKWSSTTSGTGSFTVGAAAGADDAGSHDVPENCDVVNGNTYRYYAQSPDGSQTELGRGVYNTATHTLARTQIIANSDGTTTAVNFSTNPIVDLFPAPIRSIESKPFPSGTLMLFQQTSAPNGWTKQTAHNDKALRVVSGAASSGGSNAFSTVFAQTQVGNTTISAAQMPNHAHANTVDTTATGAGGDLIEGAVAGGGTTGIATQAAGGSTAHTHSITMNIQFVDLIIAAKN